MHMHFTLVLILALIAFYCLVKSFTLIIGIFKFGITLEFIMFKTFLLHNFPVGLRSCFYVLDINNAEVCEHVQCHTAPPPF